MSSSMIGDAAASGHYVGQLGLGSEMRRPPLSMPHEAAAAFGLDWTEINWMITKEIEFKVN